MASSVVEEVVVRAEKPPETAAIRAVLNAAFAGPSEAQLVEMLRADGKLRVSWWQNAAAQLLAMSVCPR